MNKDDITLLIILIIFIVIITIIINNINKPLNQDMYIVNTYLYIYTAYLITIIFSLIIYKLNLLEKSDYNIIGIFAIFTIISLFVLVLIPRNQIFFRHLVAIIFLLLLSVCLYSWFKTSYENNFTYQTLITFSVVVFGIVIVSYLYGDNIFDEWEPYIIIAIIAFTIMQIMGIILKVGIYQEINIYNLISWLFILFFSGLLLYDLNNVRNRFLSIIVKCRYKKQLECVDYINSSIGVSIDFARYILEFMSIRIEND